MTKIEEKKDQLKHWCNVAYERALRTELQKLQQKFNTWEAGSISSFELCNQIRRFNEQQADELYRKYVMIAQPAVAIKDAIKRGYIQEDELPEEILSLVQ